MYIVWGLGLQRGLFGIKPMAISLGTTSNLKSCMYRAFSSHRGQMPL